MKFTQLLDKHECRRVQVTQKGLTKAPGAVPKSAWRLVFHFSSQANSYHADALNSLAEALITCNLRHGYQTTLCTLPQ